MAWRLRWLIEHAGGLVRDMSSWPYTPEFEALVARYEAETSHRPGLLAVYRKLVWLRKKRYVTPPEEVKLPLAGRQPPRRHPFNLGEDEILTCLYNAQRLPRDRLPYTPEFEYLYREFVRESGREVSRAEVWRAARNLSQKGTMPLKGRRIRPAGQQTLGLFDVKKRA